MEVQFAIFRRAYLIHSTDFNVFVEPSLNKQQPVIENSHPEYRVREQVSILEEPKNFSIGLRRLFFVHFMWLLRDWNQFIC